VQFWGLYCLCNEKTKTVAEVVCDGEIKLSFRRTFSEDMMQTWCELVAIVEQVNLRDEQYGFGIDQVFILLIHSMP
jgi:hypothetical protein